jgi:hypothetical protein
MGFFTAMGTAMGLSGAAATVGGVAKTAAIGGSIAQGLGSQKKADAAQKRQDKITRIQRDMANEQRGIYDEFGRPAQERAFREAESGVLPEFYEDRAMGEIGRRYDAAQDSMQRQLERRGIGLQAGNAQQLVHNMLVSRAAAEAAARTGARRDAEEVNWRRVLQGYNMGQTALGNATGQFQNVSAAYGNQAAQHQASASGAFGAAGNILGNVFSRVGAPPHATEQALSGQMHGRGQAGDVGINQGRVRMGLGPTTFDNMFGG